MRDSPSFRELLQEAVREMRTSGFKDFARLAYWLRRLRFAAITDLPTDEALDRSIESAMRAALRRATSAAMVRKTHPGIPLYTVTKLKPEFQVELTRRILASAELIKLNREQMIGRMLSRFSGWATSLPPDADTNLMEATAHISEPIKQSRFEVRRVQIDQGHKLVASINAVIAEQSGAIAAEWRSHGRHDKSYDARPEHLERDGKVYAIRGNWATERGLMNKGAGYTDDMTQPAQEPYCRCWFRYINGLRQLPPEMLTERGRFALQEVRVA